MNIMLASVTERTREIGIRRAIGAKKKQIITQFLIETVVLSTIGGIAGLFIGIFLPVLITLMAGMQTVITLVSIILPLFISVGIGIFFGLYPAFRAAEVDPIIALRHE
jgi:putative ABC transport system permease protein